MILTMMKSKIHRATVTQCDINYEGSITIDAELLEQAGILPYEQVDVLNINTGSRFTTYAIEGKRGSGTIGINGAAARLAQVDDLIIICSFARMEESEAKSFTPNIVLMNERNEHKLKKVISNDRQSCHKRNTGSLPTRTSTLGKRAS